MFDVRGCMLVLGQLRYRQHTTTSTAVVLSLNALRRWIERRPKRTPPIKPPHHSPSPNKNTPYQ